MKFAVYSTKPIFQSATDLSSIMVFILLGCDGDCNCDISLKYNSEDFGKTIVMGKDTAPKLKIEISNTQLDYAYGTQLNISTEIQLKNEHLIDCTKKPKVIHISSNWIR